MSNNLNSSKKHGGVRKMQTWEEKLGQLEPVVVAQCIATSTCECGKNCMNKVKALGTRGIEVITEMREERLAGTFSISKLYCTGGCANTTLLIMYLHKSRRCHEYLDWRVHGR